MTLSGYKFEFSPKFASNFKRIHQVAGQVRLLSQMCLVELLAHSLGGGPVSRNPCVSWAFLYCFVDVNEREGAVTVRLGMTTLHEAVGSESAVPEVIRTVIDVIVKANNWSLVDAVDNAGNTALHVAARRGRPDVFLELAALNPNMRNSDGDTPFHLAARAGHPYCIETMLQVV